MKRKIAVLFLALVLILGLSACGEEKKESSEQSTESQDSQQTGQEQSAEKPVSEMTIAEIAQHLIIEGVAVPIPCKVGDLSPELTLGYGATLSQDFEDKTIYSIDIERFSSLAKDCEFELLGINQDSTKEDIVRILGEPDFQSETHCSYYEEGVDINIPPYNNDWIYISFDKDGNIIVLKTGFQCFDR